MDQVCPKRVFPVKNGKSEHHQWTLDIELVWVRNFSLDWQCWFFGPYLPIKGVSGRQRKTRTCACVHMVVTYYIKLFRTGVDRHHGILMSVLLLVTFPHGGWQTPRYFNVCSPSRHRDNYLANINSLISNEIPKHIVQF